MRRLTTAFSACLLVNLATGCTREGPAYAPEPADVAAVVERPTPSPSPRDRPHSRRRHGRVAQHLDHYPHRHRRPFQDP